MMDIDTRLKALTRLARSQTDEAKAALLKELDQAREGLESQQDYELLTRELGVLDAIGYRFSAQTVSILTSFIKSIERRGLQYSEEELAFGREIARYRNAQTLIVKAVEVLAGLRYLETSSVLQILLDLTKHPSEQLQKRAIESLNALADYNIDVFYGRDRTGGIGAAPQKVVIDALEKLRDRDLVLLFQASMSLLRSLLSPTMEATSWSSEAVTLSRGATPAEQEISEIRLRSIQLLKRLYRAVSSVSDRLAIVDALHNATRVHDLSGANDKTSNMITRDTAEVIAFYEELIEAEDLQIVQRIESHTYWIYFHALSEEIRAKALAVERAIARHAEYQIYRVLVGFDGIFGNWSQLTKSERNFSSIEGMRKDVAAQYAVSIGSDNYPVWRRRILTYTKTESNDLATFPIFYHFLETFAKAHPTLALRLVAEDGDEMERFLIPLLRGLWTGSEHGATRSLIETWIDRASETQGRHLFASTKLFLSNDKLDVDLLKRLLHKAAELKDLPVVRQTISVAITNYRDGEVSILNELFLPAVGVLTKEGDASWIFDAWFRRELDEALAVLDEGGAGLVLRNLLSVSRIDYHAEEVLYSIAQRYPEAVIAFFSNRIDIDMGEQERRSKEFQAVPFEFRKLRKPLSSIPHQAVGMIRELFEKDRSLFQFRGGRLLKNIFPEFPAEFEAELLDLVKVGGEANYAFVLGVLRNYEGQPFIHGVCREILRSLPTDSALRTEVAIALETTGVVSGRFGLAEAYERKRQEVLEWLADPDDRVRDFAKEYISGLEQMRDAEKRGAEEDIELRKFRYGEP